MADRLRDTRVTSTRKTVKRCFWATLLGLKGT